MVDGLNERHARITSAVISAAALVAVVRDDRAGALVTFEGVVRDHHQGKRVDHLEYEAYATMAERELRAIVEATGERWAPCAIAVEHRLGRLAVGDVSVAIAVATEHRGSAFEACRYLIDELKRRVPIWKREYGPDGDFWIEGPDRVVQPDRAPDKPDPC